MPVPASINDLSTIAGNNSPAGSESPTTTDDYIRALSSFIASLRDSGTSIDGLAVKKDSSATTGAAIIPPGTTAQRPASPQNGMFRYNTDISDFEGYIAGAWVPRSTFTKAVNEAPIVTLASASTMNIGAAGANTISVSGTATITAFDSVASGVIRRLVFQGAAPITHNATSLILPGGANVTPAAGDVAVFLSLGSGNWRCIDYTKNSGAALRSAFSEVYQSPEQTITSGGSLSLTHGLSGEPTLVTRHLIFKNAVAGYSIGDTIDVAPTQDAGAAYGVVVVPNSTTLECRYGAASSAFFVLNRSSGVIAAISNSDCRLILRAYK